MSKTHYPESLSSPGGSKRSSFPADATGISIWPEYAVSGPTVVEDWEAQNFDNYTGDTQSYGFMTNSPIEGVASLERQNTSGGYEFIVSTSGLPAYPTKGDIFKSKIQAPVGEGDSGFTQIGVIFGAQDTANHYHTYYDFGNDDLALKKRSGGGAASTLWSEADIGANPTGGETFILYVEWDDGTLGRNEDDITVKLMDENEVAFVSMTANDAEFANESGFGAISYLDSADNEPLLDYTVIE